MKPSSRFLFWPALWLAVSLACSLVTPGVPPTPSVQEVTPAGPTPVLPTPLPPAANQGKIAYSSERDGLWQIMAMNADGSDEVSLTAAFGAFSRPSWSPDGSRLGMRMDIPTSGIAVMEVRSEGGRLAGSQPVAITDQFSDGPSWSPDGKSLVYSATQDSGGGWLTFVSDIGTGANRQLTGIPENATDPSLSPDGSRLAFAWYTDEHQTHDLYLINADGTGMLNLTNTPNLNEIGPAWSPDGKMIAYSGAIYAADGSNSPSDLYIINTDGSDPRQLTIHPDADFDPAWSPDGKQLAFVSERNSNNDSNYEIYLINADGSGEMRLTNNHSTDRWPTWRAPRPEDGPAAACQAALTLLGDVTIPPGTRFSEPQPFTKVWRVRNSGTCTWTPAQYHLQSVGGWASGESMPLPGAIQPGSVVDLSVWLAAPKGAGSYSSDWQLLDASGHPVPNADGDVEGLSAQIEVLDPGQAALPQPFYFIQGGTDTPQVWRLETDGRTRTQVTREPQKVDSFALSGDGRIAFVSGAQLILTDRSGGSRQVLADGLERFKQVAWSPDNNRIAYAKGGIRIHNLQTGEDTMLLENFDTGMPGLVLYEPVAWSPDGGKLTVRLYQWEGAAMNVVTVPEGSVMAEFPFSSSAWSRDSQSVYYSSVASEGMMSQAGGLWMLPALGGKAETLILDTDVWAPVHAPDGSLYYFLRQASPLAEGPQQIAAMLTRADASGGGAAPAASQPLLFEQNDTFNVSWTPDGQSYAVEFVRPAMDAREVMVYQMGSSAPLFLMQEAGPFAWGQ
jgi:TolB protein